MGELAGVFAALYAAHQVADHWFQTERQHCRKALPGWPGRRACAMHVLTYTWAAQVAVWVACVVTGWWPDPVQLLAGLLISAVTHYVADRRAPLKRLAYAVGKQLSWVEHGGGLYVLDQSWHYGWLFVAALVIAG